MATIDSTRTDGEFRVAPRRVSLGQNKPKRLRCGVHFLSRSLPERHEIPGIAKLQAKRPSRLILCARFVGP
jgi:hypothetical protein